MKTYTYIIIGAGMTADSALRGIRELDETGTVAMFGDEPYPPYNRPPLSKGMWLDQTEDSLWRPREGLEADLFLGRRVVELDMSQQTLSDNQGETYRFEKLLFATGGRPRTLPNTEGVLYFRTFEDFRNLQASCNQANRFCIIGGGFIGSELAAVLAVLGEKVDWLISETSVGSHLYPQGLSRFLTDYFREKGVCLHTEKRVVSVEKKDNHYHVVCSDGSVLENDVVVAGVGLEPNVELAIQAGLKVEDGLLVDEYGRLQGYTNLYAAGDVARFPNVALGKTIRVEHEDHANQHGLLVGGNMAGASEPYLSIPYFYSDLFDLGYEAVGETDTRHQIVEDWLQPNRQGVIYYLHEATVRGVLLWGIFGRIEEARVLIASKVAYQPEQLKGLIR